MVTEMVLKKLCFLAPQKIFLIFDGNDGLCLGSINHDLLSKI